MIPLHKLAKLPSHQRARKAFLVLEGFSREGLLPGFPLLELFAMIIADQELSPALRERFRGHAALFEPSLGLSPGTAVLKAAIVRARDDLRAELGIEYADWDLPAPAGDAGRASYPGVAVFLDDVRSPFNVGAVFRSAESFGAERIYLSEWTADPLHPRAQRTARGCVGRLPWERSSFGELPRGDRVFALELGGKGLGDFDFPERGIVVVGSEELGVSPEILADPGVERVSIPMAGGKASLNLSVAFGIMMERWYEALAKCRA